MAKQFASITKRWPDLVRLPFSLELYFLINSKVLFIIARRQFNDLHLYFLVTHNIFTKTAARVINDRSLWFLIARRSSEIRVKNSFKTLQLAPTIMIVAGLAGTVYFSMQLVSAQAPPAPAASSYSMPLPAEPETKGEEKPKGLSHSMPLSMQIDSIDVKTDVLQIGKNADNTMETPPLYSNKAGWYKHGPTPGEIGPAVIAGHVDNLDGASVFWRLGELKPGDKVDITREDGKTVTFKVNAIKQFAKDEFPTKEVYGNIDHAGLRLITCGGSFDYATGDYTGNTIVFASVIE